MRLFTYLLQVQKSDGTWAHLTDPQTGLTMYLDTISVSDTSDAELHGIAHEVMKKSGVIEFKRRVLFFQGDRREVTARRQYSDGTVGTVRRKQNLTTDHAYAIVEEGSDATTLGRPQFTWALQVAVDKAENPSRWKMAPAGERGDRVLGGNVTVRVGFTQADWEDAGPYLLQRVLSESGAPERQLYRLMIWEGIVPLTELDPARSYTIVYSDAVIYRKE